MTIQRVGILIVLAAFLTVLPARAGRGVVAAAPASVQASTLNGENIDFVRRIGGQVDDIHIVGSRAYVMSRGELAVVNIANPDQPVIVSRLFVPAKGPYAMDGSYLHAVDETGGLHIYDVQAGSALIEVGVYPESSRVVQALQVQGGYAYLLGYNTVSHAFSVQIINVSQPAAPVRAGVFNLPEWGSNMTVAGNFMYLNLDSSSIQIVSVANPAAPVSVGVYDFDVVAVVFSLEVAGSRLYIEHSDNTPNKYLTTLDVSIPSQPAKLGTYAIAVSWYNEATLVGIQGNYAYVHLPNHHGVQSVDMTNPAAPVARGAANLGPNGPGGRHGRVQGSYAYLVDVAPGGGTLLHSVNLANPAQPRAGGKLPIHAFRTANYVASSGDALYAILGNGGDQTWLQRFSLADPLMPTASISRSLGFGTNALVIEDGYAYVGGALWEKNLVAIDLAAPGMPVVATFPLVSWDEMIAVEGRRAYVKTDSSTITVIDFTTMSAPQLLGSVEIESWDVILISAGIAWFPFYTFENDQATCSLKAVDLRNPAAPEEIVRFKLDSIKPCYFGASQLVIDGATLYMASSNEQLRVFDISNPAQPALLAAREISLPVTAAMVENDTVYLENDSSLVLFDRSMAAGLPQVGAIFMPPNFRSGQTSLVRNGVVYRGESDGLSILRTRTLAAAGAVIQPNGQPFAGASIAASSGASQLTDSAGRFRFQDLPRGPLTFTPSKAGYAFWPPQRTTSVPPNARLFFQVTAQPLAAALPPGTQRSLSYTDTQGLPTTFSFDTAALSATSSVVITPTPALANKFGFAFAGHAFELAVDPAVAVTATIRYSPADLRLASDRAALALWRWTEAGWAAVECGGPAIHDPAARTLTLGLCQPGAYSLFVPGHQVLMPFVPTSNP